MLLIGQNGLSIAQNVTALILSALILVDHTHILTEVFQLVAYVQLFK